MIYILLILFGLKSFATIDSFENGKYKIYNVEVVTQVVHTQEIIYISTQPSSSITVNYFNENKIKFYIKKDTTPFSTNSKNFLEIFRIDDLNFEKYNGILFFNFSFKFDLSKANKLIYFEVRKSTSSDFSNEEVIVDINKLSTAHNKINNENFTFEDIIYEKNNYRIMIKLEGGTINFRERKIRIIYNPFQ